MRSSLPAIALMTTANLLGLPVLVHAEEQGTFLLRRDGITWTIGSAERTRHGATFQLSADGSLDESMRETSFILSSNCYENTMVILSVRMYLKTGGYSQSDEAVAIGKPPKDSPLGMAQTMICSWFFNN